MQEEMAQKGEQDAARQAADPEASSGSLVEQQQHQQLAKRSNPEASTSQV